MIAQYIPLDNDQDHSDQDHSDHTDHTGPDSQNLKARNKYRRLASILTVILTAVSVALIVVSSQGKSIEYLSYETSNSSDDKPPKICVSDQCVTAAGTISSYMDMSVNPCDNFYKFTCGKWEDDHPLPAGGYDGWNAFLKISSETRKYMKQALEQFKIDQTTQPRSYVKLYDFYHGCINKTSRNSSGYSKLREKLRDIGGWPSLTENWTAYNLEDSLIQSIKLKHFPLIRIQAMKDLVSNTETIIAIGPNINPESDLVSSSMNIFEPSKPSQPRSPEYYDSNTNPLNCKLYSELTRELKLHGKYNQSLDNETRAIIDDDCNQLQKFYNELKVLKSPNPSMTYFMKNYPHYKLSVRNLSLEFPEIQFDVVLRALFNSSTLIKDDTMVYIQDIHYLKKLGKLIEATDKRIIANYIGHSFVRRFGPFTTTKMVELLVDTLNAPEVLPNICYEMTETYLPNLLGRLYVDKRFDSKGMKEMEDIIDLIQESFNESLHSNHWMDDKSKEEAIKKVDNIKKNIAYPKWTIDNTKLDNYYQSVNVSLDDFFSSVLSVVKVSQDMNFLMLKNKDNLDGGPSVIDSWPTHDATYVNAFYYFTTNGIYFPAAIAQDPFFVHGRPMAMNLGSIGMIIGHEMTHSLDTQGSLYDRNGDLRNWWLNSTREMFLNKSQCFVDQYDAIQFPEFKMNVSGKRTLAENIADNGGIRRAYEALELYQSKRNSSEGFERLPGKMQRFNEEQLFFISFANMWCSNMFPSSVKKILETGNYSPESVRVSATLANFHRFAEAFNCSSSAKMNPIKKCVLW